MLSAWPIHFAQNEISSAFLLPSLSLSIVAVGILHGAVSYDPYIILWTLPKNLVFCSCLDSNLGLVAQDQQMFAGPLSKIIIFIFLITGILSKQKLPSQARPPLLGPEIKTAPPAPPHKTSNKIREADKNCSADFFH